MIEPSLKNPIMLRDLSGEKLDEVHEDGYYDYLIDDEYVETVMGTIADFIFRYAGPRSSVLDVGCGEGALAGFLRDEKYVGFDASSIAVSKAANAYGQDQNRTFTVGRIENFCEDSSDCGPFDVINFGGVLYCLIEPGSRVDIVEKYIDTFHPRFIIVSDLAKFKRGILRERFDFIEGETFHLDMDTRWVSQKDRCIEIYATGVERNG